MLLISSYRWIVGFIIAHGKTPFMVTRKDLEPSNRLIQIRVNVVKNKRRSIMRASLKSNLKFFRPHAFFLYPLFTEPENKVSRYKRHDLTFISSIFKTY